MADPEPAGTLDPAGTVLPGVTAGGVDELGGPRTTTTAAADRESP